ncbi:MerR family transcriptional regulator [Lysinibacter cavernae]|uniref:DNA-binding transcriptional MerR regulator n=1 Tax=Lysinibacter cavernae TaxID=1640652 RepID=A0A7X5QZ83_9MICO|nr:MerR family transcriptional regulator [Lysinibacter cavernae]NIH52669.1 DNA-binding transcriptional MerR regulator [Lysinibacter cavernae]
MSITQAGLSISKMAEATGVSAHTLRYYEREGLLLYSIGRAQSTHRQYHEQDVAWVIFLTKLRSTGMSIAQIRTYTELARQGEGTQAARLQLLVEHRAIVSAHLAETQASLAAIEYKIDVYARKVATQ